jgi:hypothetical protein
MVSWVLLSTFTYLFFHIHANTLFCLMWNVTIRFMCRWYKEGNTYPLEAETRSGNSRDSVTTAVLTLTPSRGDDGAAYRCVVWNRAMPEGSKLDARVTLSVNCKSLAAVAQLRSSHGLSIIANMILLHINNY